MKKLFLLGVVAALFTAACATTANTDQSGTALPSMTLDEALQKAQETREQLQQAKENYLKAKSAADAANASTSVSQAVKDQLQKQLDSAKATYEAEKNAWADLLKD